MLEIEYVSPDSLKPYKNNARKHEAEDVEAIMQSIKDFGFNDPIGVWGKANSKSRGAEGPAQPDQTDCVK